ncbi:hypothetical protein DFH28DRAFT_1134417 [Melampsora americana]|nr:hypothetical protein DFH28DRAFT_1134417 [Melampsora americana]
MPRVSERASAIRDLTYLCILSHIDCEVRLPGQQGIPHMPTEGALIFQNNLLLANIYDVAFDEQSQWGELLAHVISRRYLQDRIPVPFPTLFDLGDMLRAQRTDFRQALAITLERLGSNGNGASVGRFARNYKVGCGLVINCTRRVITAILDVGARYVAWPNSARQKAISDVLARDGFFENEDSVLNLFFRICHVTTSVTAQAVIHRQPDPDSQDVSMAQDEESTYDDALDVLVASDLTGQKTTTTPKTRPTAPSASLKRVAITSQALLGPTSRTPSLMEGPRKRHRPRAPSPSPLEEAEDITGTPRSTRIARLFPGGSGASAKPLGVLIQKLINVSKATLIPKSKRNKSVSVDVESAADILVLTGLIQEQASLMESRRVVFDPRRTTAPAPTSSSFASETQFEFRNADWSAKFDVLTDQIAKLVTTVEPNKQQQPQQKQPGQAKSSYASAASKHTPGTAQRPSQPHLSPRAQKENHTRPRSEAVLTLLQQDPKNISGAGKTIPELIKILNNILKDNHIKVSQDSVSPIAVRNIHRHPSNDLVIYLESPKQAQALREQVASWLPKVSPTLALKQEVHAIVVHGIPTTFNPTRPEDIDLLKTCNGNLLNNALFVRWLKKDTAENSAKRYSSLLIGFKTSSEASLAAKAKVWHGRGLHRTQVCGPPVSRCYNCQGTGHTAAACKLATMCPHCSDDHREHNCPVKSSTAMKCVACARMKLKLDPSTNLKRLFKEDHADFLHHPFAPTCPVRIANQSPPHNPSSSPYIQVMAQENSSNTQC